MGETTSATDLPVNPTAASLLGFLHEGPMTGWDLLRTAEERIGNFWSLTTSQVYAELDKLAKQGYVEVGERGKRGKRVFALTDDGRRIFREWVSQQPGDELIRFPLLLSMSFSRHVDPEEMANFLAAHYNTHSQRLDGYKQLRQRLRLTGHGQESLLTLDFGIAYEEMMLAWLDKADKVIKKRR